MLSVPPLRAGVPTLRFVKILLDLARFKARSLKEHAVALLLRYLATYPWVPSHLPLGTQPPTPGYLATYPEYQATYPWRQTPGLPSNLPLGYLATTNPWGTYAGSSANALPMPRYPEGPRAYALRGTDIRYGGTVAPLVSA
eukprot:2749948-Rhodomonas_salina.1